MSANPHTNGGLLKKALRLPDFREYAIKVDKPARTEAENTRPLGRFLRDVMRLKPWLQLCYCARSSRTLKSDSSTELTLFKLQPNTEHPHGLSDQDFDYLFTVDKPAISNFHGYPWVVHRFLL